MNEEEFIKEHPSLCKKTDIGTREFIVEPVEGMMSTFDFDMGSYVNLKDIHETQLDKQMIKKLPDGDFIIKLPENSTQEQLHNFIKGLTKSKSKRKGKIYVTNQDFKIALLDEISPYIMKQKVKEAFEPTKIKSLLMGSPFDEHPKIIQRILKEELGL